MKKPKRRSILSNVKGFIPFLAITLNLCFWIVPLMVLAIIKIILPFPSIRNGLYWMMAKIYGAAAWFDGILLFNILGIHLDVKGMEEKYPGKFYLVIANHQTWSDIFIVQHLFNYKAPLVKFLAKRELMFLPIVGWICWAYNFPFLQRRSFKSSRNQIKRSDTHLLTIAIDKFKQSSACIMNFVEGTRFSHAKSKRQNSPYKNLLKPKASGLFTIFQTLGHQLDAIIDITIAYDSPAPDFWDFLGGQCKKIAINVKAMTLKEAFGPNYTSANLPDFETVSQWINAIWEQKDNDIDTQKKCLQPQSST